jgi:hypothetical protein
LAANEFKTLGSLAAFFFHFKEIGMSDFQPGNSVLHVYNPRFVGKVIEQKDGQIKVDWGENGVSIHPIRFVVDQSSHYEKLDGPSCIAVSGNSKSKSANARKKDAPTTYRTSEDDPAELAINLSRGDTL